MHLKSGGGGGPWEKECRPQWPEKDSLPEIMWFLQLAISLSFTASKLKTDKTTGMTVFQTMSLQQKLPLLRYSSGTPNTSRASQSFKQSQYLLLREFLLILLKRFPSLQQSLDVLRNLYIPLRWRCTKLPAPSILTCSSIPGSQAGKSASPLHMIL